MLGTTWLTLPISVLPETLWFVRSPDSTGLNALEERVTCCLQAGADSAGCEVDFSSADMPPYDAIRGNSALSALYMSNASRVGRHPIDPQQQARVSGSTDMGNVSQVVPSIHPMIKVSPEDVPIHTPEFAPVSYTHLTLPTKRIV